MKTFEDLQENPPEYAREVCALFRWSTNYDYPTPAALFLDVIGYSIEEFGAPLYGPVDGSRFGYLEIGYLADALKEYAERPREVLEYVTEYLEAEAGE